MQGIILFCVLGGEILARYRIVRRAARTAAVEVLPPAEPAEVPVPVEAAS